MCCNLKRSTLVAGSMLLLLASAGAAAGSKLFISFGSHGYGYQSRYHGHAGHHHKQGYRENRRPKTRLGSGYARKPHSNHKGFATHAGKGALGCHPVSKWVTDHYGNHTKVGGTMCYDHYGQGYVIPGSRYLIKHTW